MVPDLVLRGAIAGRSVVHDSFDCECGFGPQCRGPGKRAAPMDFGVDRSAAPAIADPHSRRFRRQSPMARSRGVAAHRCRRVLRARPAFKILSGPLMATPTFSDSVGQFRGLAGELVAEWRRELVRFARETLASPLARGGELVLLDVEADEAIVKLVSGEDVHE